MFVIMILSAANDAATTGITDFTGAGAGSCCAAQNVVQVIAKLLSYTQGGTGRRLGMAVGAGRDQGAVAGLAQGGGQRVFGDADSDTIVVTA